MSIFRHFLLAGVLTSIAALSDLQASNSGSDTGSTFSGEDADGDGLSNGLEALYGTQVYNAYSDSDSKNDGTDAVGTDSDITFDRLPEVRYAVMELPGMINPKFINDQCVVIDDTSAWRNDARNPITFDVGEDDTVLNSYAAGIDSTGRAFFNVYIQHATGTDPEPYIQILNAFSTSNSTATSIQSGPAENYSYIRFVGDGGQIAGTATYTFVGFSSITTTLGTTFGPYDMNLIRPSVWSTFSAAPIQIKNHLDINDTNISFAGNNGQWQYLYHNQAGVDDDQEINSVNSNGSLLGNLFENHKTDKDWNNIDWDAFLVCIWNSASSDPSVLESDSSYRFGATSLNSFPIAVGVEFDAQYHVLNSVAWLGDKNWMRKELPMQTDQKTTFYPSKISNRGEILGYNQIWRNGHVFYLYDLAALDPVKYAGVTSIKGTDINNDGIICGTMYKGGTASVGVLLIPVEMKWQNILGTPTGNLADDLACDTYGQPINGVPPGSGTIWGHGTYLVDADNKSAESYIMRINNPGYLVSEILQWGSCNSVIASSPSGYQGAGGIELTIKMPSQYAGKIRVKIQLSGQNDGNYNSGSVNMRFWDTEKNRTIHEHQFGYAKRFSISIPLTPDATPYRYAALPNISLPTSFAGSSGIHTRIEVTSLDAVQ